MKTKEEKRGRKLCPSAKISFLLSMPNRESLPVPVASRVVRGQNAPPPLGTREPWLIASFSTPFLAMDLLRAMIRRPTCLLASAPKTSGADDEGWERPAPPSSDLARPRNPVRFPRRGIRGAGIHAAFTCRGGGGACWTPSQLRPLFEIGPS